MSQAANIISSRPTQDLLEANGLKALRVTWEDTGRTKGSCWGPNISDMTLVTKDRALMPVIRKPNFSDVTVDVPIDSFKVRRKDKIISLKDLLKELNLYAERDETVLSASQCCVIECPKDGKTEFAVQLFNYQSRESDPAVLVILATAAGTSVQVLGSNNETLYFDDDGVAKWLTVERLENVRKRKGVEKTRVDSFAEMTAEESLDNSIMMIQVPLKQRASFRGTVLGGSVKCTKYTNNVNYSNDSEEDCADGFSLCDDPNKHPLEILYTSRGLPTIKPAVPAHGMDMGQLGVGSRAGTYVGTKRLTLTRDEKFPVRCTFQYYRVTDDGTIAEKDVVDIKKQLDQIERVATAKGSLVLSKSERPTEPVVQLPMEPLKSTAEVWQNETLSSFTKQ